MNDQSSVLVIHVVLITKLPTEALFDVCVIDNDDQSYAYRIVNAVLNRRTTPMQHRHAMHASLSPFVVSVA